MLTVRPIKKAHARLTVPADKSISHRAALMAALADGTTRIGNYSQGHDCASTLRCVQQIGARVERDRQDLLVHGTGPSGPGEPDDILDCGNSGTTMRLMSGILAGQPFFSILTGDASLRSRPMKRVLHPLRKMGARVDGRGEGAKAPLAIRGGRLSALDAYAMPVASAQLKSCLLLAGLHAEGVTSVVEPTRSRDHTERMFPLFGASLRIDGRCISISGGQRLKACSLDVPGDISSASFWLALGAMHPDCQISVLDVGLNPLRSGFIEALKRMGCDVKYERTREGWENVSDVTVSSGGLRPIDISPDDVPAMIDEIPVLAVCAAMANGTSVFSGVSELRYKESDRIAATVTNLRAMGVEAEEHEDGFVVFGRRKLHGAIVRTGGDHRIAMAFAIAGLVAEGETVLDDAGCVDISYPGFVELLHDLSCKGEVIHG